MILPFRITKNNFSVNSLDDFERRQEVKRVYRKINGEYVLIDNPYIDDWNIENRKRIAGFLLSDECIACGAGKHGALWGLIGLRKQLFDDYMILDILQVQESYRRMGIGRILFEFGKAEAKNAGAKALYISACSSEETIAFYRAMGAEITDTPIKELADEEPFDVQMVCKL